MRRTLGFILPVLVSVAGIGCFLTGNKQPSVTEAGPPTGDRDHTLAYWGKLRGVLAERTKSDDLRSLTRMIQKQVDMVHNEPIEGVDLELVAVAQALARNQEKVIQQAELADYRMEGLRSSPDAAKQFSQANQQASAMTTRLKELRAKLAARYGVAFPPLDG
jgi:hypothetical protein